MKRRNLLLSSTGIVGTILLLRYLPLNSKDMATASSKYEITKTEEEWRKILTSEQFYVLRKHGTEGPHTSKLDKQYAKGTYECAACELPLFSSETKFDSGTGWPSFYASITNATGTTVDNSLLMSRVEVHCRRCGGHLGHVFDDGPPPTGKRYCMNGVSLKFITV